MKTKKYLTTVAGLLLILGLILLIRQPKSESPLGNSSQAPEDHVQRTPRSVLPEKGADQLAESGVIEIPQFGQIAYSKHRIVRVAELMKHLHEDDAFRNFMTFCKNVTIDIYEDAEGFLLYLEHNPGKFRSQQRDAEALALMKGRNMRIDLPKKLTLRMDDDEFVKLLLKKIHVYLTFEGNAQYQEKPQELSLWPVIVEFSDAHKGEEPKNVELPSIMTRHSLGIPKEYLYEEPYARNEIYLREWHVYYYKKGDSAQEGYLIGCAAQNLVEPRLDLPEISPQK